MVLSDYCDDGVVYKSTLNIHILEVYMYIYLRTHPDTRSKRAALHVPLHNYVGDLPPAPCHGNYMDTNLSTMHTAHHHMPYSKVISWRINPTRKHAFCIPFHEGANGTLARHRHHKRSANRSNSSIGQTVVQPRQQQQQQQLPEFLPRQTGVQLAGAHSSSAF